MVKIALAIEREIEGAQNIQDTCANDKRKEGHPSFSSGKKKKTYIL